ncbi:DNA starvation/stationary phase protection protein [Luedemannella helvata]|uniref:DNA starvation/stationary phase protection protein n=1 Tax=Luedemannella helvata TaxID=349315 RepID=A0ABN2KEX9_9ACTN
MPTRKTGAGTKNELTGLVKVDVNAVGTMLQETLVELTDLHLRGKQAHWNLAGPTFKPLHEQLDEVVDGIRAAADEVAERAVAIGYAVDGRPATVGKSTPLAEFPAGQITVNECVELMTMALEETCNHVRQRIGKLDELDPVSQDTLIGVLAELEKFHWMFAVQRVGAEA